MPNFLSKTEAVASLEKRLAAAKDKIEKFAIELRENPYSAMSWADKTFLASAKVYVYSGMIKTLNNPKNTEVTVEGLCSYARDQALHKATFTHSTSQSDNLARMAELQVWAELAEPGFDNPLCHLSL